MIKNLKLFFSKHLILIFCLLLSFIALCFTSKNSFFYPLNDWMDANAFFTVGKSLFNGVIPYKMIFEQKGILLYLLYGIGYLFSNKSFIGVFVIEVILFTIYLYYTNKTIRLFLDKKYVFYILPILTFLITTSVAFVHGGSCEEFCFPMFAVTLYYFFKHFKEQELDYREYLICGLMAGLVFLMKYTLLGFWFAFMMFMFLYYIFSKKYKKAFMSCIFFLMGMLLPILISLVYFILTGSLKDFIDCYFLINMTAYNRERINIIVKISQLYDGFFDSLYNNGLIIFIGIIISPLLLIKYKIPKYAKFSLIGMFLLSVLGLFWGLRFYNYYILPIMIFLIISLIGIFLLLDRFIKDMNNIIIIVSQLVVCFICILFCYINANYREMLFTSKENMFQYKYAEYISKYDNPTLLNMGGLDGGLYTTTGIVPNTKFFEVQNIPYDNFPDNLDDMKNNVMDKNVMFILYYTRKDFSYIKEHDGYIFDNYELVLVQTQESENDLYNAFLFKVKS